MPSELTEKSKIALKAVLNCKNNTPFSAAQLSERANIKIHTASLNALVTRGLLNRIEGKIVQYEPVSNFEALAQSYLVERAGNDNVNLNVAKARHNDEFYTRYEDIEKEVMRYAPEFQDKIVYLNCDNPIDRSNAFWDFFTDNFYTLGLKRVIATYLAPTGSAYKVWVDYEDQDTTHKELLNGNGDFRSPECIDILQSADIICTNPPFSLFKEFLPIMFQYNKKFLIIGPLNGVTYRHIFQYIKDGSVRCGYNNVRHFIEPDGSQKNIGNAFWYTNLPRDPVPVLELKRTYNNSDNLYKKADNFNAIVVDRVENIPKDYYGCMAVPISFFQNKHNPEQFEIIGCTFDYGEPEGYHTDGEPFDVYIDGKKQYKKLFIKRIDAKVS